MFYPFSIITVILVTENSHYLTELFNNQNQKLLHILEFEQFNVCWIIQKRQAWLSEGRCFGVTLKHPVILLQV